MIVIVDYRMGNVGSILNMLRKIKVPAVISSDAEVISQADKLILPGVGAFDTGMIHIQEMGLLDVLSEKVMVCKAPMLGICLGMQILTRSSEEGVLPGLGWISGATVRFHFDTQTSGLKIPHMGWNVAKPTHTRTLFNGLDQDEDTAFYFVHSYHVVCDRDEDVLATTYHGYEFASAVACGNVMGTQFHPEKSHRYGLRLLKNFSEMT